MSNKRQILNLNLDTITLAQEVQMRQDLCWFKKKKKNSKKAIVIQNTHYYFL